MTGGASTNPVVMDIRPRVEPPYSPGHPLYLKHRANIEIVARQLESEILSGNKGWSGRVSRVFWEKVAQKTMVSIRDVYDCVKKYGMTERDRDDPASRIQARVCRGLTVRMVPRNSLIWQTFIASQRPIAISFAIYGDSPVSVYEPPGLADVITKIVPGLVVGYDSERGVFIIQGPFNTQWGEDGYIAMPFEHIENHSIILEAWVAGFSSGFHREKISDFDTISFDVSKHGSL